MVFGLTLARKQTIPCERVLKTVLENGVFSCVPFCFRSDGRLGGCVNDKAIATNTTFSISIMPLKDPLFGLNGPDFCQKL